MLDRWVRDLAAALDVEEPFDSDELLDAARVIAHRVERRAAPLSTFLIGVAAGRAGTSAAAAEATTTAVELARSWHGTSETEKDPP